MRATAFSCFPAEIQSHLLFGKVVTLQKSLRGSVGNDHIVNGDCPVFP